MVVTGDIELVTSVDSGERAERLTTKELENFIQVGANATEFIKIMPGFAINNGTSNIASYTGQTIGINGNGDGGQSPLNNAYSYHGLPTNSLDITADGAHVSDPGCNCATPVNPNSNMISEFKISLSNFSAENQKGPGVVSSIAKGGGKDEVFRDVAQANGVAQATRLLSGWGLKFFDYDNDGSVDLILANGHPDDMVESYSPAVKYREPLLLFHQENGKLRNVSDDAGPAFRKSYAARGLAVGDFNNDSLLDVLIGVNGGAPVLLKNQSARENHWVGLKLEGVNCNRDGIGARIRWSTGGLIRSRLKNSGGSYLSAHDPREALGVATVSKVDWVEVTWPRPSGKVQRIDNPPIGRYMRVTES